MENRETKSIMASFMLLRSQEIEKRRRPRVFRDRTNPLDYLSDEEVVERYRLPRNYLFELIEQLDVDIRRPTMRSHAVSPTIQVLATIRCLTKGIFYSESGDLHGISKSSVCVAIDRVLSSLNRKIDNIKFPSGQDELRQTKMKFYQLANFPNVIGAVDGTLIKIQAPSENEPNYVCRKGFHALNVMAVADASLRFTDLVCKWPGAVHDSFVLQNSPLNQMLSQGCSGWLLGDSGYPLKSYLMTPISNPNSQAEVKYNSSHCRTRVVVERAFGVLKSRFRCLHPTGGVLPFTVNTSIKVIVACFKLHNKCIALGLPLPEIDLEDDGAAVTACDPSSNQVAQQVRQRLLQHFQ